MKEVTPATVGELILISDILSMLMSDGHFTLLRFTTGWKCCFYTPEPFREVVRKLPAFDTPSEAIMWAVAQKSREALPR